MGPLEGNGARLQRVYAGISTYHKLGLCASWAESREMVEFELCHYREWQTNTGTDATRGRGCPMECTKPSLQDRMRGAGILVSRVPNPGTRGTHHLWWNSHHETRATSRHRRGNVPSVPRFPRFPQVSLPIPPLFFYPCLPVIACPNSNSKARPITVSAI